MNKKNILIISFSHLKNDPRVFRQIFNLQIQGYNITAMGLSNPEIDNITFIKVDKTENLAFKLIFAFCLLFHLYELYYWNLRIIKQSLKKTKNLNFDLIIANDLDTLALACKIKSKTNCKILYDAHEYSPKEHEDKLIWNILFKDYINYTLLNYISNVDKMFTVCEGIAQEYEKNFNINPIVVTNATEYCDILPKLNNDSNIKLIHHGGSIRSRKIENMILMMDYLDKRFILDLMLVPSDKRYHKKLKNLANSRSNVKIIDPVPMKNIVNFISSYDIGLYILEPTNFNNGMALPNKIFEFIQARLAIAIGPSPEMKKIVKKYNLGVISDDYNAKSLASKLNSLNYTDILKFKSSADVAAKELNSENNVNLILNTVKELIPSNLHN
jgi:hypothetical protein